MLGVYTCQRRAGSRLASRRKRAAERGFQSRARRHFCPQLGDSLSVGTLPPLKHTCMPAMTNAANVAAYRESTRSGLGLGTRAASCSSDASACCIGRLVLVAPLRSVSPGVRICRDEPYQVHRPTLAFLRKASFRLYLRSAEMRARRHLRLRCQPSTPEVAFFRFARVARPLYAPGFC